LIFVPLAECHEWSAAPSDNCFRHWSRGCFCSQCCIGCESMAVPRVNLYLDPPTNAKNGTIKSSICPSRNRIQPTRFGDACSTNCITKPVITSLLRETLCSWCSFGRKRTKTPNVDGCVLPSQSLVLETIKQVKFRAVRPVDCELCSMSPESSQKNNLEQLSVNFTINLRQFIPSFILWNI